MSLIRISESDDWIVDYDRERGMYRVSYFEDNHFKDEYWFDCYEEKEPFIIDFSHLSDEEVKRMVDEMSKTGIIGAWDSTPVISIPALISWLNDQKYTNIDETGDDMTEEFEREHRWELSRNCFINKMIKQLEELK